MPIDIDSALGETLSEVLRSGTVGDVIACHLRKAPRLRPTDHARPAQLQNRVHGHRRRARRRCQPGCGYQARFDGVTFPEETVRVSIWEAGDQHVSAAGCLGAWRPVFPSAAISTIWSRM
jgi:hypothetical protein